MSYGKLYGVGAGPGAPDLVTLRALAVLQRVPVLALPRSSDYGASKAWEIIEPSLGEVSDPSGKDDPHDQDNDRAQNLKPITDGEIDAESFH